MVQKSISASHFIAFCFFIGMVIMLVYSAWEQKAASISELEAQIEAQALAIKRESK